MEFTMKKVITAAAIAAIMGASSAAVAEWDMPFFGDDNDSSYYNDNRWNNDGYGYGRGDGRGRGKGRGSFNFNMDADADTEFDGETSSLRTSSCCSSCPSGTCSYW
ncbi:hypothetical protein BOW31_10125 [Solemya velum gill symbiont]|nr:hypothetical protein BOW31_10125 [Solemya velum gill symbiont]